MSDKVPYFLIIQCHTAMCFSLKLIGQNKIIFNLFCSDRLLSCRRHISCWFFYRRNRRRSLPTAQQLPGWPSLHLFRDGTLDHSHIGAFCVENLSAAFLNLPPKIRHEWNPGLLLKH